MIANILKFIFGTANQRSLNKLQPLVSKINEYEEDFILLDDLSLLNKTQEFKQRHEHGESLDSLMPEAFAATREASKRNLGQRHYDVQLIGGAVLYSGKIAEMKTGEGKTLTATLALYLNAISGKGAHLVTVNDYLAGRDAEWMMPVYKALGISVGALQNSMYDSERKKIYNCDIVYGTNSEFGFDYLRDNMKFSLPDYVQRELNFAIIDEADSILIDEARTPLIISGNADDDNIELSVRADRIIKKLKNKEDYEIDEKERSSVLTEAGVDKIEKELSIPNLYSIDNIKNLHYITQSLKANSLFKKDVDYIIVGDEVLIVDEFTGRVLQGRRYSDGLHQAIEAKENVKIQQETQTLASITLQNYFRLYNKLSGMTGTALTEAEEFHKIYKLDVISIPTNKVMQRVDKPDYIFLSERSKFNNIVKDIKERYEKGQPVLIGTVAVETSEKLSKELSRNHIPHEVLNAKQHEREAEIIEHAGHAKKITIATNMAGRGTDIKLSKEARELGGLYILGTERHENRRIDNQLRGRSGRQGDAGESRFYISLEDSLIKRFGKDSIQKWMGWVGMQEDEIIEDEMISGTVETAQEKVEKHNFEIRKQLIEYDDVLNQQRIIIYNLRKNIISGGEKLIDAIKIFFYKYIDKKLNILTNNGKLEFTKNIIQALINNVKIFLHLNSDLLNDNDLNDFENIKNAKEFKEKFSNFMFNVYLKKNEFDFNELFSTELTEDELKKKNLKTKLKTLEAQKWFILENLDHAWRQHIVNLDNVRDGIGLRGYGQKTPIIEYKHESFELFQRLIDNLIFDIVEKIISITSNDFDSRLLEEKRMNELREIEDMIHSMNNEDSNDSKKFRNRKERRSKR